MSYQLTAKRNKAGAVIGNIASALVEGKLITLVRTKNTRKKRILSEMMNMLLMVMFIPVFAAGVYMILNHEVIWYRDSAIITYIEDLLYLYPVLSVIVKWLIPLLLGCYMHELAHGNACRACKGGRVYEYGIILGLIPGFYTAADDSGITGPGARFKKLQIMCAGVEANILLAGISLILSCLVYNLREIFLNWADLNLVLCAFNILFFNKMDGQLALAHILGLDVKNGDFIKAMNVVRSRRKKKMLLKDGPVGLMKITVCYIFELYNILYPLIIVMNVLIVGDLIIGGLFK